MAKILIPIPAHDFDPSEVAISWRVLTSFGHEVFFATPDGGKAEADPIMVTGRGLDPWSPLPFIGRFRLIGHLLRADARARRAYKALLLDPAFLKPLCWAALEPRDYDGLLLPGGHCSRGMREYLESRELQAFVATFFDAEKPVAAICHGVLLAARSISPKTGRSVLYGRKTTALTWAQERAAWHIGRIGRFWDPNYYRTYNEKPGEPEGYMSVEQEVTRALASPRDFLTVCRGDPDYRIKTSGLRRDSLEDSAPAFVVRDGNYVSARWPGDAHSFAKTFSEILAGR